MYLRKIENRRGANNKFQPTNNENSRRRDPAERLKLVSFIFKDESNLTWALEGNCAAERVGQGLLSLFLLSLVLLFFLLPHSLRSTSFTFHGLCRLITYCLTGLMARLSFHRSCYPSPMGQPTSNARCRYGNTWRNVTSADNAVNGVRVPQYLSIGICCRDSGSPPTFVVPLHEETDLSSFNYSRLRFLVVSRVTLPRLGEFHLPRFFFFFFYWYFIFQELFF